MFHVKHDNPLNKPIAPTTTQKSYGEAHPPQKKKSTPSKYTHGKRITKKQSRIMTNREIEPHSSNSQKELPTILRFHVKRQLLGNDEEENSSQKPSSTTQPPRPVFHVKRPKHHKISEDAICCSTAPHSFSAFHVKQLGCCRDAVFHVKHSAGKALFPEAMATAKSEMDDLFL